MIVSSLARKVSVTKMERWSCNPLQEAVDTILKQDIQLTEFERGLLHFYKRQFKLHALSLPQKSKTRVYAFSTSVLDYENGFRLCVQATTEKFQQLVNRSTIVEAPSAFIDKVQLRADNRTADSKVTHPCLITLADDIYPTFMQYCSDRKLRRNAYDAWIRRAGSAMHGKEKLSNHNTIVELRKLRRNIARELGYNNHADLRFDGFMATKVETVVEMLDLYRLKYWDKAEREIENLLDFAKTNCSGFDDRIEPWDVAYLSRRFDEEHPSVDWARVREYFPLDRLLTNLFSLFRIWFNIEIERAEPSNGAELPHKDVDFYLVRDLDRNGEVISAFYFDAFRRSGKIAVDTMLPIVDRSDEYGRLPVAYVSMNLRPGSTSPLLNISDVGELVHSFGSALQHVLTRVDQPEVAGQNNIPPDAVNICGLTFRQLMSKPVMIRHLASHHRTGEPMPEQLVMSLASAESATTALPLLEKLYTAAFDLDMWVSEDSWREIQERLWKDFMPLAADPGDEWPCSASNIFCNRQDATLYSPIWGTTVAGDIVNAFGEIGVDLNDEATRPEAMRSVMERFRSTFLSLGGAVPAAEVFRRFRGRDPVRTVDII